jgi:hypothetical protein
MADQFDAPTFTEAELALADALVLIMDVLALHGIMKPDALDSVFAFLEKRYRANGLRSSAAMAEYLRDHLAQPSQAAASPQLHPLLDQPPKGTA